MFAQEKYRLRQLGNGGCDCVTFFRREIFDRRNETFTAIETSQVLFSVTVAVYAIDMVTVAVYAIDMRRRVASIEFIR